VVLLISPFIFPQLAHSFNVNFIIIATLLLNYESLSFIQLFVIQAIEDLNKNCVQSLLLYSQINIVFTFCTIVRKYNIVDPLVPFLFAI
jgi:hypothetical protein